MEISAELEVESNSVLKQCLILFIINPDSSTYCHQFECTRMDSWISMPTWHSCLAHQPHALLLIILLCMTSLINQLLNTLFSPFVTQRTPSASDDVVCSAIAPTPAIFPQTTLIGQLSSIGRMDDWSTKPEWPSAPP